MCESSRWLRWIRGLLFILLVRPLVILLIGVRVLGKENLKNGPFILIANHASHVDTLVLLSLFPVREFLRIRPVAAADYWTRSRWVYRLVRFFFFILPIPRKGFTARHHPIHLMEKALASGCSLIIYPEGTRSYGEDLGPFKPGVARLLVNHPEIPCIPVYLRNTARILPKGTMLVVPLFVDVVVGPPIKIQPGTPRSAIVEQLRTAVASLKREIEN